MYAAEIAELYDAKPCKLGYLARCTCHDDSSPSLHIRDVDDKVLMYCFAGCNTKEVLATKGLGLKDLFHNSNLTPIEKKAYARKKNIMQLFRALNHELHVLYQVVSNRVCDDTLSRDTRYKKNHPEFKPLPMEFWERELIAVKTIKRLFEAIYGK